MGRTAFKYGHLPDGCVIYKLSFPDGSFYIGKSRKFRRRYCMYMTDCKTGRGNPKLTEKILKFGEPNVEILETFDESVKLISDLEMSEIELRYIKTQKPNLNRQYF